MENTSTPAMSEGFEATFDRVKCTTSLRLLSMHSPERWESGAPAVNRMAGSGCTVSVVPLRCKWVRIESHVGSEGTSRQGVSLDRR
jgi:hypothetical protein